MIFFISDNGGRIKDDLSTTYAHNKPLLGGKFWLYEGGIRVPFYVQWTRYLPKGKVYNKPVISLDIFPTVVSAANSPLPQVKTDGVNLLPYLTSHTMVAPHNTLYWRYNSNLKYTTTHAIRHGNWKLVKFDGKKPRLFNLEQDIHEKNDLAQERPDKVKELNQLLATWQSTLTAQPVSRFSSTIIPVGEEDEPTDDGSYYDVEKEIENENQTITQLSGMNSFNGAIINARAFKPLQKVITPNGDQNNDSANFNNMQSYLAALQSNGNTDTSFNGIKIFDTNNRLIRELNDSDSWDGKDNNGFLVETGVYIYQYNLNNQIISGTAVVAR